MGAGAVGGYFGARLAASGATVVFYRTRRASRGDATAWPSRQEPPRGPDIHSEFASGSDRIAPVDLVLFAVKSQDTEEAARSLAPVMGRTTVVLSLQNGVDNADRIARLWGGDRSLAGVAYVSARVSAPGVIEHSGGGRIALARCARLARTMPTSPSQS